MRVLVSGGTGFIGSHLVYELKKRGCSITVLTSRLEEQMQEDFLDKVYTTYQFEDMLKKLEGRKYDVFFHLGWAGVDGKDKNNIRMQYSNIKVAIDMMQIAKKMECDVFIAAGTVAEYVFSDHIIDFSMKQTPNDVYGATKVAIHYLLEAIGKQINQDMIWVVLPSTFGEGRKVDNIITYTITSLLNRERPIYGNLEQMWDFLYVTEVARALADIGEKGMHNTIYGIGSGQYRTLKDFVCTIRDMIDPSLPLGIGERIVMCTEPKSSCINIEQLTKDTGFIPRVSFEEGMEKTIRYYRTNLVKRGNLDHDGYNIDYSNTNV